MAWEERKFETKIIDIGKIGDEAYESYMNRWLNEIGNSVFFHCFRNIGSKMVITISYNVLKSNAHHTSDGGY